MYFVLFLRGSRIVLGCTGFHGDVLTLIKLLGNHVKVKSIFVFNVLELSPRSRERY